MSAEESADAVTDAIVPRKTELLRPCRADLAMVVAALATLYWWGTTPTFQEFLVVVVLWIGLWVWRVRSRGWWFWGPIAALVTTMIAFSGQPHWAVRTAASCLNDLADQALDSGQVFDQRRTRDISERRPGRCGAFRWRDAYVVDVGALERTPPDQPALGLVVVGAGPPYLDLHGGPRGYVYSPDRTPASCVAAVGLSNANNGFHDCRIEPVFGDWYWFVASSSFD